VSTELTDRLDRLEGELVRLEIELEQVRALVAADELVEAAEVAAPDLPVEQVVAAVAPAAEAVPAPPPPKPSPAPRATAEWKPPVAGRSRKPKRSLGQLAQDWDLVGARGFAIVGGAVLALGIGLFFVLAANRGWIGESARIALGAIASTAALAAGLWLHARFGQYWAALGAVGAGIAGAYATLAAATARYDLVPDALGLPLAGVIAAIGTAIAIRWHSQVIAGIGLLGAALAPALQAIDTGLTWESVAFALIVLAAAAVVTVPRGWHELLNVTTPIVAVQSFVLVAEAGTPADRGTVGVTAALAAIVLATAIGLQLASSRPDLDPAASTYALVGLGIPLATTSSLFVERGDRGLALLAAAGVWVVALAVLAVRRQPDLAVVVGVSALALTTVGTALLISDAALTVAWSAQAIVLAVLAARFADARLHVTGIAYAALAAGYTLAGEGAPRLLFDEVADHRAPILPLAASAAALVATGFAARVAYAQRTETGLLGFLGDLRKTLEQHRLGIREILVLTGAAVATCAASFALVSASWDWGHVAATEVAALAGAAVLVLAGALRRDGLALAGFVWLGGALGVAFAFDVPEFWVDETETSIGGWSLIVTSAALLGGSYVHRLLWPAEWVRDLVAGAAAAVAAASAALGIALVAGSRTATAVGLALTALAYAALAAAVFRVAERRNVATTLWSLSLVLLLGAELLLVSDGRWRAVVVGATAVAVGAVARPLREERLWLAGGALATLTTSVALLVWADRLVDSVGPARDLALGTAACAAAAFALAGIRWDESRRRDLVTALWAIGLVALLATERVLVGDVRGTAIAFAFTGAALALAAHPLREPRVWTGGAVLVGVTLVATLTEWVKPSHLLVASASPADGLWVLAACLAGLTVVAMTAPDLQTRVSLEVVAGGVALYGLSLAILEVAVRVSGASVETDFERGHTAVSGLWALVGLALLVVGLLRGSTAIRYAGLTLFGLSLAKIFLYDLSSLSSVARAFSFILVGALLLAGGFFLQRLSDRLGPPRAS
jgi:uncharacterized membrane protein